MNENSKESTAVSDEWSEWLLGRRHGDDPTYQCVLQGMLDRICDRLLDGARLEAGMTLADIGTGDGLVAFRAISRIGSSLRVILTDLSAPLLSHTEQRAIDLGVHQQCSFFEGTAEKLDGLDDATVDVVTTRAVLAYVPNKAAALREFYRVLKPGGRISIADPILRDQANETIVLTRSLSDEHPAKAQTEFLRLVQRWKAAQFPSTMEEAEQRPITNYTERDLARFVRVTGFINVHLELHIDTRPSSVTTWDVFLNMSPHPWAPPLREIFAKHFTEEERQLFENVMRPLVESRHTTENEVIAYLTAEKPTAAIIARASLSGSDPPLGEGRPAPSP